METIEKAFPQDSVRVLESSDLEVYIKIIFVRLKVFIVKFCTPEAMKIPTVTLPGVGGSGDKMVGVLFRTFGFPKQIPHFIVKLKSRKAFQLDRLILDPSDIRRLSQARETWSVRCEKEVASRPKEMQLGRSAHSYDQVRSAWVALEEDRKRKLAERDAQQKSTDDARAAGKAVQHVKRVVRGANEDDELNDYAGASKKGRGNKPKAKAKAQRGRGKGAALVPGTVSSGDAVVGLSGCQWWYKVCNNCSSPRMAIHLAACLGHFTCLGFSHPWGPRRNLCIPL